MAVNEISQEFIQKFAADTLHLAQQKKTKLRHTVNIQSDVANKFTFRVTAARTGAITERTGIGTNAGKRTATNYVDQVYNNRVVVPKEYTEADSWRAADAKRMLENPQSILVPSFAMKVGRFIDDIIIASMFAAALDDLGNSNAHPAGSQIGGATTAPSIDLVLLARELLAESDIDPDEQKFFVCTPNFITALLNDTKATSADFVRLQALNAGKIDSFAGFTFIESNRLTSPGGTPKQIYGAAYTRAAIGYAFNTEAEFDIGKNPAASFDTTVQVRLDAGAVRVQDAQILRVHYLETN